MLDAPAHSPAAVPPAPTTRPPRLGYIPALDGIRGISILAVMAFHTGLLRGGFLGVDLFFVLSGFLITSLLIEEYDRSLSVSLKNFYLRRALRLGPALLLFLTVFSALSVLVLSAVEARRNVVEALISLFYVSNWAKAFSIHAPQVLVHTWSLSIEEQFYVVWPLTLLFLLRTVKHRWAVAAIAALIALGACALRFALMLGGASIDRVYAGLDTRADALMFGCVLGIILSSGLLSTRSQRVLGKALVVLGPLSAAGLALAGLSMRILSPSVYYWGLLVVEALGAMVILDVLVNKHSILRPVLSMRWLAWIGSISYGVYLWHPPIYKAMKAFGFARFEVIALGTLVTFAISTASFYLMEKPILRLKERLARPARGPREATQ
jgi:peptidoglycan/LPS O-acetylase OafA/YrhL